MAQSGRAATEEAIETRRAEVTVQAITGEILGHGWNTDSTRKEQEPLRLWKKRDHGEDQRGGLRGLSRLSTKALSLATRSFPWKVSFGNPCSIRVPSVARLKILSEMKDFFL